MGRLCPQIWSTPFGPEVSSELVLLLFIVVSTETKAAWSFLLFHIVLIIGLSWCLWLVK